MIGDKLQSVLDIKGIKPGSLASMTGIPKSTIYSIIKRNNKNVEFSVIERISDALGVPVEFFYDRDGNGAFGDEKKPATANSDELDVELIKRLMRLSPEEITKVDAFVQGLLASR